MNKILESIDWLLANSALKKTRQARFKGGERETANLRIAATCPALPD